MNKLLTIVIPTYNMQAYLHRCLDSLIVPNKQLAQLEVLVINDGSKDNSSAIAHQYESKYPSTFYVIDKENGNYGSCINCGLAEATGKYIKILDADDWFDTNEFSKYLEALQNIDVDMILTKHQMVDDKGDTIKYMSFDIEQYNVFDFQEYKEPMFFAMHTLAYKTSILREIKYKQTEGISYTDQEWIFFPQHRIKTCIYLPLDVYRYVIGREGQTMDAKVLIRSIGSFDKLLRNMVFFAKKLSPTDKQLYTYQRLEDQIIHLSMYVYRACLVLQNSNNYDKDLIKSFDEFMHSEYPKVYKQAGKLKLKKFIPIHYVRYWRLTGKRFSVDWIRDTYRKIRYNSNN